MPRFSKAFTVIELMVVLAIAGVLMTMGVPALGHLLQEARATSAANTLVSHLRYARQEAIMHNTNVSACPSSDGLQCSGSGHWENGWIVYRDPGNSSQPERADDILRVIAGHDRLVLFSGGRSRVRFQGHGGAYGTNLTIRICDPEHDLRPRGVIVSNPGRVRVSKRVGRHRCPS